MTKTTETLAVGDRVASYDYTVEPPLRTTHTVMTAPAERPGSRHMLTFQVEDGRTFGAGPRDKWEVEEAQHTYRVSIHSLTYPKRALEVQACDAADATRVAAFQVASAGHTGSTGSVSRVPQEAGR